MVWRPPAARHRRPRAGRTAVYEFRGSEGHHIYVGVSNSPRRRFAQHAGEAGEPQKWWWKTVDHRHTTIQWYPTRALALAAEARLINELRPPGNQKGNPDWEQARGTVYRHRRRGPSWVYPLAVMALAMFALVASVNGPLPPNPLAQLIFAGAVGFAGRLAWRRIR